MTIEIHGRGIEPTPALRQYALRRVTKLRRHHAGLHAATVVYRRDGRSRGVEVRVQGDGFAVFGRERGQDIYLLLNRVVAKLARQIDGHLDRCRRFGNCRGQYETPRVAADTPAAEAGASKDDATSVRLALTAVGIERYPVKPMTVEEALAQLPHARAGFVPFRCADTGEFQVLYRRPEDGAPRLVLPEP